MATYVYKTRREYRVIAIASTDNGVKEYTFKPTRDYDAALALYKRAMADDRTISARIKETRVRV